MSALSDKLAKTKFPTKDVTICLDAESVDRRQKQLGEVETAERAIASAKKDAENGVGDSRLTRNPVREAEKRLEKAQAELARLEEEMKSRSIRLRFTAVPFGEYNKFIVQNPPRKDHDEAFNPSFWMFTARRTGEFVDEAGAVHEISKEEWDSIENSLTDAEHDRIAATIFAINRGNTRGVDFLSSSSDETPSSSETSD